MKIFLVELVITGIPKILEALIYFLIDHLNLSL